MVVQKALPVGQHVAQAGFAFWRGVYPIARAIIGKPGPGVRRMSMSTPLRVRKMSTAVAVHSGRALNN